MRTATPGNLPKLLPEAVRYQGRTPHSVEVLTARQAPAPQASAGEQAFAQAPIEVVPPKKVALTIKSGKPKNATKVVRTRPRSESYAHVVRSDFARVW